MSRPINHSVSEINFKICHFVLDFFRALVYTGKVDKRLRLLERASLLEQEATSLKLSQNDEILQRLDHVDYLEQRLDHVDYLEQRLSHLENTEPQPDERILKRLEQIENRMDVESKASEGILKRLDKIEKKMDGFERRLEVKMETKFEKRLAERFAEIESRLVSPEAAAQIDKYRGELTQVIKTSKTAKAMQSSLEKTAKDLQTKVSAVEDNLNVAGEFKARQMAMSDAIDG